MGCEVLYKDIAPIGAILTTCVETTASGIGNFKEKILDNFALQFIFISTNFGIFEQSQALVRFWPNL